MKTIKNGLTVFCLLSLLLTSCKKEDAVATPGQAYTYAYTNEAMAYLNEVVDIMEKNSFRKNEIDWTKFRKEVFNSVPTAQTIEDAYPGIWKALSLLADNHGYYTTSGGLTFSAASSCTPESIENPVIPNDIGYVKVMGNQDLTTEGDRAIYVNQLRDQIMSQDHLDLKGWIVDLRNNTGGNCYPMLAGIGPILGEGIAGYRIYPDGHEDSWSFQNGYAMWNVYIQESTSNSYELFVPNPKVAVLLNAATVSAGEVIAVSFIGRENTKSFGSATFGSSTGTTHFLLRDKAKLVLGVSCYADRNKNNYGGAPINPDVISSKESIIKDAISWIRDKNR